MSKRERPHIRDVAGSDLGPELVDRMLVLLDRAFGGWSGPPIDPVEHMKWKYADDPGGVRVVLAELGGELVGMQSIQRQPWLVKGVRREARIGNDLAVDPAHQGRGVYSAIAQYDETNLADYDLVLTYSTLPQTIHVTTKQGQQLMGTRVRFLMRVLNPVRFGDRTTRARKPKDFLIRGAIRGAAGFGSLRSRLAQEADPGIQVGVVDRFDERVDGLLERTGGEFDLVQFADSAYLNWRFADPRGGDFTILFAESGNDLLGYAVIKPGSERAYVADLLTLPGRTDAAYALLQAASDSLAELEPDAIAAWLPASHPYSSAFRRCGFVDSRGYTGASYRALSVDPAELAFLAEGHANIHVVIGDTDHV